MLQKCARAQLLTGSFCLHFFGFYMFGKFLNEVSTNKIDFYFSLRSIYFAMQYVVVITPCFSLPSGVQF